MPDLSTGARITLRNLLFLTDFSKPSEAALPYVIAIAREYGASVCALHVLLPDPYVDMASGMATSLVEAHEDAAKTQMQQLEPQLAGTPHETILARGSAVWPALEEAIEKRKIDLIAVGTRGRTGALKFLLGSVAEEIFRRSPVPVITIGPSVRRTNEGSTKFERVLFATDFRAPSRAAGYAISLAQEHQAQLILLHVIGERERRREEKGQRLSVAEAMHQLHQIVPPEAELWCRPETVVEHGEPAARILEAANQRRADLIVLGIRRTTHILDATHVEAATAHQVVAHAPCPVLTVGNNEEKSV